MGNIQGLLDSLTITLHNGDKILQSGIEAINKEHTFNLEQTKIEKAKSALDALDSFKRKY